MLTTTTHRLIGGSLYWQSLPQLPDKEGFAGSFSGVSRGALLVAGGANFPDKRPWEGGTKIWHDRVFALESRSVAWRDAGRLPSANGYGVSATVDEGFVLVGGGDAQRNFAEVWLARWDGESLKFAAWPALPKPLAQAAGAVVGRTLYLAGGLDRPGATQAQRVFLALDLDHRADGWQTLEPCPGPERFLAVAAAHDGAFYLFGGARLVLNAHGQPQRELLRDAWRYRPGVGWTRLTDLPRAAVAAPTPAPVVAGRVCILGGDDGSQTNVAPTTHRGFQRDVLAYDPASDQWSRAGEVPFSLLTTSATIWQDHHVVPGGEARPGVRSPAIWAAETK